MSWVDVNDTQVNSFNTGKVTSRATSGVNFGISGTQVTIMVGLAAAAVIAFFYFQKKR